MTIEETGDLQSDVQPDSTAPDTRSAPPNAAPEGDTRSSPSPQPTAAPQTNWGVMENFRKLPQFQGMGEEQIARALYQSMQQSQAAAQKLAQYQQLLPHTQDYLTNRPQYEAWKASQSQHPQAQQAQQLQPQQPQQKSWWDPPKVRDTDMRWMTRDPETGRDVISPDAPLDVRRNLEELQAYKADFAKNFLSDPEKTLGPMVETRAKEIAQQIVQETLKTRDTEQFVDRLEQENADWLFDSQTGQVTPEGFLVHKYIEEAKSLGIKDPKDRWEHATRNVERELLIQRYQEAQSQLQQVAAYLQQVPQQQPPQPPAPPAAPPQAPPKDMAKQNMEFLRREASRSPSRSAGTANTDPRAAKPKMSFEQMFVKDAQARGLM